MQAKCVHCSLVRARILLVFGFLKYWWCKFHLAYFVHQEINFFRFAKKVLAKLAAPYFKNRGGIGFGCVSNVCRHPWKGNSSVQSREFKKTKQKTVTHDMNCVLLFWISIMSVLPTAKWELNGKNFLAFWISFARANYHFSSVKLTRANPFFFFFKTWYTSVSYVYSNFV